MALDANPVRATKTKTQHVTNQSNPKKLIQQTLPMSASSASSTTPFPAAESTTAVFALIASKPTYSESFVSLSLQTP